MPLNVGLRSSCTAFCQHPECWNAVRKQEKGISKSLPPLDIISSDDSDSELDLPTQSVCNLLADYGESETDRFPASTGGRPSHQWTTPLPSNRQSALPSTIPFAIPPTAPRNSRSPSLKKLEAPHNTKVSLFSKKKTTDIPQVRSRGRRPRMPLVEVQEVFDTTDLNSQWDETFVTKQYYIWMENPQKKKRRRTIHRKGANHFGKGPLLMKDMTDCMVPSEIEQEREDTVLKKHPRTASPPSKVVQMKKAVALATIPAPPPPVDVDMEGINEILALPKDVLLKVLDHTKKSDFTSKGKLHEIVQQYAQNNDSARMMLSTRELFKQKKMKILNFPKSTLSKSQPSVTTKPVFHVDDEAVIERLSSANTPVRDKDQVSENSSDRSFPHYKKPLPKIQGQSPRVYHLIAPGELVEAPEINGLPAKAKLPSISLGLPELPSGVRTTRPFAYNTHSMDFSLGPVISPPSTVRSSNSCEYSEHGTTMKVNVPTSELGYTEVIREMHNNMGMHHVSPALSTNVPLAPAGTPATFMYPSKSAPNMMREVTKDPTGMSINLSMKAQSSFKDNRDMTLLSSPASAVNINTSGEVTVTVPIYTNPSPAGYYSGQPDDKGLDMIRETAREGDGSAMSSSPGIAMDKMEELPKLILQTSTFKNISTGASPIPKSARSVESCPSQEQWPLISESSFEKLYPRPSVSEPALSVRSARRQRSQVENGIDRAIMKKVMDEKNTAESPAPPPPSPEPKDSNNNNESNSNNEFRVRKDNTKSRESLSMAPLFEVNEIDEEGNISERTEYDSRRKQVRKIHAVIPQAKDDDDKKFETDGSEEPSEEIITQITVMHVAPKGKVENKTGANDKVQETFLNVDIPAEEISSCRAEHGFSHQEDISYTNKSVVNSEATAANSQVSTVHNEGDNDNNENENVDDGIGNVEEENVQNPEIDGESCGKDNEGSVEEERQYLEIHKDFMNTDQMIDSARWNSEASGLSPEFICDSARFMSHDLVSPIEGEEDEGKMQMMSLLRQVEGSSDVTLTEDRERDYNENNTDLLYEGDDPFGKTMEFSEDGQTYRKEEGNDNETKSEMSNEELKGDEVKLNVTREISGTIPDENDPQSEVKNKTENEKSTSSSETVKSDELEVPGSFFFHREEDNEDNDNESKSSKNFVDKKIIEGYGSEKDRKSEFDEQNSNELKENENLNGNVLNAETEKDSCGFLTEENKESEKEEVLNEMVKTEVKEEDKLDDKTNEDSFPAEQLTDNDISNNQKMDQSDAKHDQDEGVGSEERNVNEDINDEITHKSNEDVTKEEQIENNNVSNEEIANDNNNTGKDDLSQQEVSDDVEIEQNQDG